MDNHKKGHCTQFDAWCIFLNKTKFNMIFGHLKKKSAITSAMTAGNSTHEIMSTTERSVGR